MGRIHEKKTTRRRVVFLMKSADDDLVAAAEIEAEQRGKRDAVQIAFVHFVERVAVPELIRAVHVETDRSERKIHTGAQRVERITHPLVMKVTDADARTRVERAAYHCPGLRNPQSLVGSEVAA